MYCVLFFYFCIIRKRVTFNHWSFSFICHCAVVIRRIFHDSTSKKRVKKLKRTLGEVKLGSYHFWARSSVSSPVITSPLRERAASANSDTPGDTSVVLRSPTSGSSQHTDINRVLSKVVGHHNRSAFQYLTCLRLSVKQSQRPVGLVAPQSRLRNLLEEGAHLLLAGEQHWSRPLAPELEN